MVNQFPKGILYRRSRNMGIEQRLPQRKEWRANP